MKIIESILLGLATRRLTHLVVSDQIFESVRELLFQTFSSNFWIRYLLTCTRCASVWAAAAVILLSTRKRLRIVVSILALSEMSIILDEVSESVKPRSLME